MNVLAMLVCPEDKTRLVYGEDFMRCPKCLRIYKVRDGIPVLIP